jgi:hypothetical protein
MNKHLNFKLLIGVFLLLIPVRLFSQSILVTEDDFVDPAGSMSLPGVAKNISPPWQWDDVQAVDAFFGHGPPVYDGITTLEIPIAGNLGHGGGGGGGMQSAYRHRGHPQSECYLPSHLRVQGE